MKTTSFVSLLAWVALLTQGCAHVSTADARQFSSLLGMLSTSAPETQLRLLLAGCGEIASCANGCEKGFKAVAELDDDFRYKIMGECFDDAKATEAEGVSFPAWFHGYLARYVGAARAKLEPGEQSRLDELWARTALDRAGTVTAHSR